MQIQNKLKIYKWLNQKINPSKFLIQIHVIFSFIKKLLISADCLLQHWWENCMSPPQTEFTHVLRFWFSIWLKN